MFCFCLFVCLFLFLSFFLFLFLSCFVLFCCFVLLFLFFSKTYFNRLHLYAVILYNTYKHFFFLIVYRYGSCLKRETSRFCVWTYVKSASSPFAQSFSHAKAQQWSDDILKDPSQLWPFLPYFSSFSRFFPDFFLFFPIFFPLFSRFLAFFRCQGGHSAPLPLYWLRHCSSVTDFSVTSFRVARGVYRCTNCKLSNVYAQKCEIACSLCNKIKNETKSGPCVNQIFELFRNWYSNSPGRISAGPCWF